MAAVDLFEYDTGAYHLCWGVRLPQGEEELSYLPLNSHLHPEPST